jgi:quercetin dioxygenase-like cupin family protein
MIVRKAKDLEFEELMFGDRPRGIKRKWLISNRDGDDSYGHRFAVREFIQTSELGEHWHKYVEAVYIISGRAIFRTETEEAEVGAGDIVYIASDEVHGSSVLGDEPLHVLCCIDCVDGGKSCDPAETGLITRKEPLK